MPYVHITNHLRRFFPELTDGEILGETVAEIVHNLDSQFKGFASYLTDERGCLRPHVSIFVGNELIRDRNSLSDHVESGDSVHILQALSGG